MQENIESSGEQVEISEYLPEHYFDNQTQWASKTIPLNPKLRSDFDDTPNSERDDLETEHWWGKPFIVSGEYWAPDTSYQEFYERMKGFGDVESESEWLNRMAENKAGWFKAYPTGTAYEVRCLTGGAWDRSSWIATVATLKEAIKIAQGSVTTYPTGF